jgi:hypothetical protein
MNKKIKKNPKNQWEKELLKDANYGKNNYKLKQRPGPNV